MSVLTQLDDYNWLLMAVSKWDIPCLQQIINVALCNGASIHQVVNKLEDALEGAYHPWGYDANDLDIATLVYRLGGCQLLFVLSQKLAIPSLRPSILDPHSLSSPPQSEPFMMSTSTITFKRLFLVAAWTQSYDWWDYTWGNGHPF
jgi:hypothetical protein